MEPPTLAATRVALQTLAEHLLAADLWARTGRIGLRATPGGFGQPELLVEGERRRIRVDGARIVVLEGEVERWAPITTPEAAAAFCGVRLGAPEQVFTPETDLRAGDPLELDAASARWLADWFDLVGQAIEQVRSRHAERAPTLAQLWPEHFDLATSMSEVNLGGSPGDGADDQPYLYVGPWAPVLGPGWNEPWGMSLVAGQVRDVADAVDFFEAGFAAAVAGPGPA